MSTVVKALSLLDLFSEDRARLTLSAFQRLSGRDKATVHRYLTALESIGFLEQDEDTRSYRLGHAIDRLAAMRRATVDEGETIAPLIEHISAQVGELVHVNRLAGSDLRQIHQADLGQNTVRVTIDPALRLPLLRTSSGKVILAFLAPQSRAALLEEANERPAPSDEHAFERYARQGYAQSQDLMEAGVSSIAIPLFDAKGLPFAACSVAYPTSRQSEGQLAGCIQILCHHGPELTRRLGGTVPEPVLALWCAACGRTDNTRKRA